MKPALVLLCSGLFYLMVSSNRLRVFTYNETEMINKDAFKECKLKKESFVTLFDEDDAKVIASFTNEMIWLGLRKRRNITWSDGASVIFSNSSVNLKDNQQICEAIENNTWRGFNCSDKKSFMCYKGNDYTLVEKKMDWCHALQYCRRHYTDLVSISNETQNKEVIKKGKKQSFWIGLMHDEWEWTDKSCSSFRKWRQGSAVEEDKCTIKLHDDKEGSLYRFGCGNDAKGFVCSKGNVRIKVIQIKLTWNQAYDYCKANHTGLLQILDEDDQFAVEQWLEHSDIQANSFWIGLRQTCVFGFWFQSDRTVSYSNWKGGKQPEMPLFNHCGVITRDNYTWRDEDCLVRRYFLCEEEIIYMEKDKKG